MTDHSRSRSRRLRTLLDPRRLERAQAIALLALLACAAGLWLFAVLTEEVLEGDTHAFDEALLLALRSPGDAGNPLGPAWLEYTFRDLTALGGYPVAVLIAVVAVGYLLLVRAWGSALMVPLILAGGLALNNMLKIGLGRPRPTLVAATVSRVAPSHSPISSKPLPSSPRRLRAGTRQSVKNSSHWW